MKHLFSILLSIACVTPMLATSPADDAQYNLVWNEDFTESTLNLNGWNIETNGDGGGNNELQYYCDRGVSLGVEPTTGKHCLILTATKEDYKGKHVTSGRINSKQKMYFTYGKIEARIRFPKTANGLWPAFWMMGNDYPQVGWPKCGETDFIELGHQNAFSKGTQERYFNGAMHLGSAWNTVWSDAQSTTWPYSVEDTFHIVTIYWTPTSMTMYMDRESHPELDPYFTTPLEPNDDANYNRQQVFGKPNFLIFNLAVGGNFPGLYDINKITALSSGSSSMYVDWVRIYQKGVAGETFHSDIASEPIEQPATALESVADSDKATKRIVDGQLLIEKNGQFYDLFGNLRN